MFIFNAATIPFIQSDYRLREHQEGDRSFADFDWSPTGFRAENILVSEYGVMWVTGR